MSERAGAGYTEATGGQERAWEGWHKSCVGITRGQERASRNGDKNGSNLLGSLATFPVSFPTEFDCEKGAGKVAIRDHMTMAATL